MFELKNIQYFYGANRALSAVNWSASQGECCLLHGPSGSGKTTLLHLLAGIIRPQKGEISVLEKNFSTITHSTELDRFRGAHIGIVFQKLYLVEALTILDNLLLAPYFAGEKQKKDNALQLLSHLGLSNKAHAHPSALSYGEAQRVAIARAVINHPQLILADEPTSSLDDKNCDIVLKLLQEQAKASNATLVVATHDSRLRGHFSNRFEL